MLDFSAALQHQLQVEQPTKIDQIPDKQIDILLFKTSFERQFSILCTSGLSNYAMTNNTRENNHQHIELCFALPSYWDLTFQSESASWVVEKLMFLSNYVINKNTYFWDGHSIPNKNPNAPFSNTMQQSFLFFSHTLLHPDKLTAVHVNDKIIHLLFLIPIFQNELDRKISRGPDSLKKKMLTAHVGEILDDFRTPVIKKLFGFL
jgi:hypothetical protein